VTRTSTRYFGLILLLAVLCSAASGCVRRRLTVRSAPAGATVYVDEQPIGETPVSTSFTYYGTRNIRLVKDNFETLSVKQTFNPPWYQYPVIDFVTENLWPWEIRDERVVDFPMIPQQIVPTERLLERAQELRDSSSHGVIVPPVTPGEQMFAPPNSFVPPTNPNMLPPPTTLPPNTNRFPPVEPSSPSILPPGRVLP
jgi:hypothetical protein